jgi:ribose 5-phosphate isomerase B
MRIAVAADHAGFPQKQVVIDELRSAGHQVTDLGTNDPTRPSDYPDLAVAACERILEGEADRAVLVCGSGVGICVAANKFPGIRAGTCHDHYSAHQGVEHDDMNVLCLGARIIGPEPAREIVSAFVGAVFSRDDRHARRLSKVKAIEARWLRTP